jgi:hypothetical protein
MNILKRVLKVFFALSFFILCVLISWINVRLHHHSSYISDEKKIVNEDVIHQLKFLERKIYSGAADEMQNFFPEGFVFMHSLYGLTWCDLAKNIEPNSGSYNKALTEAQYSLQQILSEKGKSTFPKNLEIPYGIYYTGWSNYLLGRVLQLQTPSQRDSLQTQLFKANCDTISKWINSHPVPFAESYAVLHGPQTWLLASQVYQYMINYSKKNTSKL